MSDDYSFPPYAEDIPKILEKFGGEMMETYLGKDIKPLWNLSGEGLPWSKKFLYKVPKLEKITFAVQSFRDKLMSYATIIWPEVTSPATIPLARAGRWRLRLELPAAPDWPQGARTEMVIAQ